jgi:hypothetical protein
MDLHKSVYAGLPIKSEGYANGTNRAIDMVPQKIYHKSKRSGMYDQLFF